MICTSLKNGGEGVFNDNNEFFFFIIVGGVKKVVLTFYMKRNFLLCIIKMAFVK